MTTNGHTDAENLFRAHSTNPTHNILTAALESLKGVDTSKLASAELVPLVNNVKAICEFAASLHAEIELRAIGNGELIPGVVVKDATVHRRWTDAEAAAQLAQEAFGDKAFSRTLLSPAQMEKLDGGAVFVAMAAVKPPAAKKVVY